jgi:drug/metabolite transporter (DMT)-like permease
MSYPVGNVDPPRAHHTRGIALMLFSTVCFTTNVLLIRTVGEFETVNVWLVSCMRFAVGLALLSAVYWRATQFRRVFTRPKLAGRGFVGGIGVYTYYLTVVHLGPGRATFINNIYIALAGLFAVWILRERFRSALAVGSILALTGLALLTNAFTGGSHATRYDLLAIAGAFANAYVVITIRLLHAEGEHTATIFAAQCTYGALLCAIPVAMHMTAPSPIAWTLMAGAGLCAGVGQLAMTGAFRHLPVGEGALFQILVPVGIATGGYVFFREHFAPHELIGAALILIGTVFTLLRRR